MAESFPVLGIYSSGCFEPQYNDQPTSVGTEERSGAYWFNWRGCPSRSLHATVVMFGSARERSWEEKDLQKKLFHRNASCRFGERGGVGRSVACGVVTPRLPQVLLGRDIGGIMPLGPGSPYDL